MTEWNLKHISHPWKKVGVDIYCSPCNKLLYEGSLPKTRAARIKIVTDLDKLLQAMKDFG